MKQLDDGKPPREHNPAWSAASNWRAGCRCGICRDGHNDDLRERRRDQRERDRAAGRRPAIPAAQILRDIESGMSVKEAATRAGLTEQQVHSYALREDPEFGKALDAACEVLCVDAADRRCGTATGYRKFGCRATDCRRAHAEESRAWRAKAPGK